VCRMMLSVTGTRRDPSRPWPLGPKLEKLRTDKKLSIREAADAAGFSAATWGALEKGYKTPTAGNQIPYGGTVDNVVAAAQVVGMDPAEALRLAGLDPTKAPSVRDGRFTLGEREVLDLLARLDLEVRDAFVTMLKAAVAGAGRGAVLDGDAPALPPAGEVASFSVKRTPTSGT
jgi:transcriptional regulator with XRE-family HTH domain